MQERINRIKRENQLKEEEKRQTDIKRKEEVDAKKSRNKAELTSSKSFQEFIRLMQSSRITELMQVIWQNYRISVKSDTLFASLLPRRLVVQPPPFRFHENEEWSTDNSTLSITISTDLHSGKYRESVGKTFSLKVIITKDNMSFLVPTVGNDTDGDGFSTTMNIDKKFSDFDSLVDWIVEKIGSNSPLNRNARFDDR